MKENESSYNGQGIHEMLMIPSSFVISLFYEVSENDDRTITVKKFRPLIKVMKRLNWVAIQIGEQWHFFTEEEGLMKEYSISLRGFKIAPDGTLFDGYERYPSFEEPWFGGLMHTGRYEMVGRLNAILRPSKASPLSRILSSWNPSTRAEAQKLLSLLLGMKTNWQMNQLFETDRNK
jgi:hypothetical protein